MGRHSRKEPGRAPGPGSDHPQPAEQAGVRAAAPAPAGWAEPAAAPRGQAAPPRREPVSGARGGHPEQREPGGAWGATAGTAATYGDWRGVPRTRPATPDHGTPVYETPGRGTPAYETPGRGTPAYETPGRGIPAYETPGHGIPAYETPGRGIPAYETPGRGIPAYETPGRGTPVHETPGHGIPAYGTPGRGTPLHDTSGRGIPVHQAAVHQAAGRQAPVHDTPAFGTPAVGFPQVVIDSPMTTTGSHRRIPVHEDLFASTGSLQAVPVHEDLFASTGSLQAVPVREDLFATTGSFPAAPAAEGPLTSTGPHQRIPAPRTPVATPADVAQQPPPASGRGGKGRTYAGMAAAAVTVALAVIVAGQAASDGDSGKNSVRASDDGNSHTAQGNSAASRSDDRPTPDASALQAVPELSYDQKMAQQFPIDAKLKGPGAFDTVPGVAKAPGKGKLVRYRVDVEQGLGLDAQLFAEAVHRTLNDDRSWGHGGTKTFERVPGGEADFVITLASPGTTGVWCKKSGLDTTIDNVSCDSASTDRVMINAFRWAQGSVTFGADQMFAYRQMLINHEVGHRLGHGHVSCQTPGALAPIMQQQTKSLDINGVHCQPNPWVYPGS
ncbi:DUF3152 domain-containing protein [Streptomyces sp. NPDC002104]